MPINIPNDVTQIEQRAKTDVQRQLLSSNPFLKNSWLGAIITSFSNRIYDFYLQLKALLREVFWDTSTGDFLKRQGSWFGYNLNPATKAKGNVVATGVIGSNIPISTVYKTSDGKSYSTLEAASITNNSISILSIERVGDLATVTTIEAHNMSSDVKPTISGVDQPEYNGSNLVIQITGLNSFTYNVSGSPVTPATGLMLLSHNSALIPIQSLDFQSSTLNVNLTPDTRLSLEEPIIGVDSDGKIDFNGVVGGSEIESDNDYRTRFLDGVHNPTALFNVQAIKDKCKEITGVTRVFVREITPNIGQVTVYFIRDNDVVVIPTPLQISQVKTRLLTIKPANTSDSDVIVLAPKENKTDFTFTALTPDTPTMRESIKLNLDQFFKESTDVGFNVDEDAYRSAIISTVDTVTGEQVKTFDLDTPVGDLVNASDEISTLGDVSFVII